MAAVQDPLPARPNIRIEIKNNLTEPEAMDVEEGIANENEDGEILDDDDDDEIQEDYREVQHQQSLQDETHLRTKGIFTTGINIFDKQTQEKLEERAKRFALKPEEIHSFTDADLEELYESLGITNDVERITRFDTVHMYGINGLTTEDILEYFAKYAPTHIEWIDADSCNVRWFENITAARAMFYTSKGVNGMPARKPVNTFAKDFLDDVEDDENNTESQTGESILLKNRDVELRIEDILPSKVNLKNAVDISEITIRIPPGYWRLGEKHAKVKCILLRYAFRTDKKSVEVIDLARYYKKLGNLRLGNNSENGSDRGLFERNRDLKQQAKNPWGSLAKDWNKDRRFCEPDPNNAQTNEIEIKNPRFLLRLGKKKSLPTVRSNDDDHDHHQSEPDADGDEEPRQSNATTKPMPRMRMYADEEEERQRRRRALQKLKRTEEMSTKENHHHKDLRNVLRHYPTTVDDDRGHHRGQEEEEDNHDEAAAPDLGARLKNRTQRMVFTLHHREQEVEDDGIDRRDARRVLQARRRHQQHQTSASGGSSREPPPVAGRRRERSPYHRSRREPSLERYTVSSHQRSPLLHRKRSHQSSTSTAPLLPRHRRGHMRSDYMDDSTNHKPMSKVAVVIKKAKKPVVASTIWSKVKKSQSDEEDSSSDEDSEDDDEDSSASGDSSGSSSSQAEEDDSESNNSGSESSDHSDDDRRRRKRHLQVGGLRSQDKLNGRLRITMRNNHYDRK